GWSCVGVLACEVSLCVTGPSWRSRVRHRGQGRSTLGPGLGLFELGRQPHQRGLIAESSAKLHPNRQTLGRPEQWHTHGSPTCLVEKRRQRSKFVEEERHIALHIVG